MFAQVTRALRRARAMQAAGGETQAAGSETQAAGAETQAAGAETQAAGSETQAAGAETQAAGAETQAAGAETQATGSETQAAGAETQAAGADAQVPAPAGPSELMPLLVAMDFMVQDGAPAGKGLLVKPADYPELTPDEFEAMMDDVEKVVKTLRVLEARKPCLFRAIKLWAGVH